jgi:hypothetical protein
MPAVADYVQRVIPHDVFAILLYNVSSTASRSDMRAGTATKSSAVSSFLWVRHHRSGGRFAPRDRCERCA